MDEDQLNLGIDQLKEVLTFGASFGNALGSALQDDGRITLGEYVLFIGPLLKLAPAVEDIDVALAQLLDMDETEKQELLEFAKTEFDIADDDAEVFVEDTLRVALEVFSYVKNHFIG